MLIANLPPQSIDLEQAVIGAMLTDKDCLVIALTEISNAEMFYIEVHQNVFKAMKSLLSVSDRKSVV